MTTPDPERPLWDRHLWEIRPVRDVLTVVALALLMWLGYALRDITVPLLVALLLAYLCEPAIAWMTRARWIPFGRTGAVSILLLGICIGVLAGVALVIPQVVGQTMTLVRSVEDGTTHTKLEQLNTRYTPVDLQDEASWFIDHLPNGDDAAVTTVAVSTGSIRSQVVAQSKKVDLWGIAGRTGAVAVSVGAKVVSIGLLLFLIPFYFFFFSLWFPDVLKFVDSMIPGSSRDTVLPLLSRFDRAVAGFVRGRLFIAFLLGIVFAVGWGLIGVPYAVLLSLITAVLCLVPFISVIMLPVAIGLLAATQLDLDPEARMAWWGMLLWPTVVFAVAQLLDGWILQPVILGKTTDLDPVTIFVAVLAGGAVLGLYGMLIAIPVAACVKILLVDLVIPKLRASSS